MKKLIYILFLALLTAYQCEYDASDSKPENANVSKEFEIEYKKIENSADSASEKDFQMKIVYPFFTPENSVNDKMNENVLRSIVESTEIQEYEGDYNIEEVKEFIEKYANGMIESMASGRSTDMSYFINIRLDTSYVGENILFLSEDMESYTGGAHGYEAIYYHSFDRNSGKKLKLNDVFADTVELQELAEKYFLTERGMQRTSEAVEEGIIFEENLTLNQNFTFSADKIIFAYNPYEIGPYSMGTIVVEIPMESAKHLINDKYRPDKIN